MTAKRFELLPFLIVFMIYAFYAFAEFKKNENIRTFFIEREQIEEIDNNDDSLTIKLTPAAKGKFAEYTANNIGKELKIFLGRNLKISEAVIKTTIDSGILHIQKPSGELLGEVNKWLEMNNDLVSQ